MEEQRGEWEKQHTWDSPVPDTHGLWHVPSQVLRKHGEALGGGGAGQVHTD